VKFPLKRSIQRSLISSDFYLRECGNRRVRDLAEFKAAICKGSERSVPLRIFLDGVAGTKIFTQWNVGVPDNEVELYIHQGDVIPPLDLMKKMNRLGFKLHSVNWLGDLSICKPIPIGIPTKTFDGIHGDLIYKNVIDFESENQRTVKYQIYVNFNLMTNVIHRKLALEAMVNHDGAFIPNQRLSVSENLKNIQRAKYVISPPGAGVDCYRTWEALYLGAIPVVLRKHWPFSHLDLPVVVVDSYASFLHGISGQELSLPKISANYIRCLPSKFL
jgi:hypothetical protein